ncbi:XdhC family protein [Streptomyces orinoci]|uniref:XdhC/CoxI family protein n=1 Tax=Streptomyces orinoci TaxID=67339 RepID=A0ABV3JVU3_STRON|nr:XdhC/CoxI family protein [Streptomyces orinoci]
MLDIADELRAWCVEGREFAVATVVATQGSAPRPPGAALAVDAEGMAIGSVSGGCVEAAVYESCRTAIRTGEATVERFGYSDEDAFAAGLTCGGSIEILVAPVRATAPDREVVATAVAAAAGGEPAAMVRVVDGPGEQLGRTLLIRADGTLTGSLGGSPAADRTVAEAARRMLDEGYTGALDMGAEDTGSGQAVRVLIETSNPAPRLIIFGAIDFASALAQLGKFLGYHVTVCDARAVFATAERFPQADEVVVDWPHRYLEAQRLDGRTVLCVLTHDVKFDIPLLTYALQLPVAYVGAMGSRRTHFDRVRLLREAGVSEEQLARLRSPIGLDLGARTPEETALSIAAQIVADLRGGTGVPLSGGLLPIHHDRPGTGINAPAVAKSPASQGLYKSGTLFPVGGAIPPLTRPPLR